MLRVNKKYIYFSLYFIIILEMILIAMSGVLLYLILTETSIEPEISRKKVEKRDSTPSIPAEIMDRYTGSGDTGVIKIPKEVLENIF